MAAKKTDSKKQDAKTLKIKDDKTKSHDRVMAEMALLPAVGNSVTANLFAKGTFGDSNTTESFGVFLDEIGKVKTGDLSTLEGMLTAQAITLDKIFNEMARRSASNMGEFMNATETYMKLALKAQSQCRATVEALAEIKHPQPVNFVQQANFANGPQQVNNGVSPPDSRAENFQNQSNELLEDKYGGETLDSRTTQTAIGKNQEMAAVG